MPHPEEMKEIEAGVMIGRVAAKQINVTQTPALTALLQKIEDLHEIASNCHSSVGEVIDRLFGEQKVVFGPTEAETPTPEGMIGALETRLDHLRQELTNLRSTVSRLERL